ncbi:MAG: aldose epimerase family protein [Proteiniphilum sp.]
MCKIQSEEFGNVDGQAVYLFRLVNDLGTNIKIISYGATIKSIHLPDEKGKIKSIILGYDTLEKYVSDKSYLGATIGRCANRISNASFVLGGGLYSLDKNDGPNCNHGGYSGFHQKLFDHDVCDDKLILSVQSPDGEGGFPGNITFRVTYQLTDGNELLINYHVSTDRRAPVNITNHAYFNLSGEKTILEHQLKIESDTFLESDDAFLPTGRELGVEENPGFDFRSFSEIGKNSLLKQEKIKGFNTYFIAREKNNKLKKLATLRSVRLGVSLEVYSTMPGIMIYTGDYLSGNHLPFSGISLEAHGFPDSPNRPEFPQSVATPDKAWQETIVYRFI